MCIFAENAQISQIVIRIVHLASFMDENELNCNHQHSFRSRHSCLPQLILNFQQILVALNERKNVDVICFDFAKAFDKYDH